VVHAIIPLFIPLPPGIALKKACINVANTNYDCFKYALLVKFADHKDYCILNKPVKIELPVKNPILKF
jgi:hypothetical protein